MQTPDGFTEPSTDETDDVGQLRAGIDSAARALDPLIRKDPCTGTDCIGCALGRIQYGLFALINPTVTIEKKDPDADRERVGLTEPSVNVTEDSDLSTEDAETSSEPAPADDLPGEPVEPGDLRAGDRVAYTYRWKRYEGALVVTTMRRQPITTLEHAGLLVTFEGRWAGGISDVRLIERAPAEKRAES